MGKGTLYLGSLVACAALFSGCVSSNKSVNASNVVTKELQTVAFEGVKVPQSDYEKRKVTASKKVFVNGKEYNIGYRTILRSGDKVGEGVFGMLYDKNGKPVVGEDGNVKISNDNDFSSLIPFGNKLFMVSHFETRPAAMYITELQQLQNGELKALNTKNIDFSAFNGLWVPCAGSVTPWNTHLGSEEYEPDSSKVKANGSINPYYDQMGDYYGGDLTKLNSYDYGWTPEIKVVSKKGDVEVKKHYSMGRFAHELAYILPDERTVLLSDDGTNVGLFMFIADKPKDLSSGTLYAAKWHQTSSKGAGSADLGWINLGHSSNANIKKALDQKLKFSDIFEKASKNGNTCPASFKSVNTTMGAECLKLKDGMDEIASRLETRRYAALKGATTEFRKMEGISYNPNDNVAYLAMSEIAKGMEDLKQKGKPSDKYDGGSYNDIKLEYNKCGAVYELQFKEGTFIPKSMSAIVAGIPDSSLKGNKCSVDSLANPDNVTYMTNTNTLIIGEDTGSGHQNDYIWSFNTKSKKLTRIQTTPYGSETTSPYYYNNINGHGYIMSVVQHPYGEGDALTKEADMPKVAENKEDMRAYTGYIGPFPVISK